MKQVVTPSSSREPGTLQYGVLHSRDRFFPAPVWGPVAARSDGRVVCATCNWIVAFDAMLHETGQVDVGSFSHLTSLAAAPDDTVYALISGAIVRMTDLDHLSAANIQKWPAPVELATDLIVAGAEGPYTGMRADPAPGTSASDSAVRGFDAQTGQPRTLASGQYLLAAARGGGVLTVEQQGKQTATLRQLDPSGMVVWSHTLTSTVDGLAIHGAAVAADGGVSVFGGSASAVDLGDGMLASAGSFVAGFDASGAPRWAFSYAVPSRGGAPNLITHIAQTAGGALLIAGQEGMFGDIEHRGIDSTLSVATPAGISRTLRIDGSGHQVIGGLAAAPDGAVWVQVSSFVDDDLPPEPVFQIGDHTFADPGEYLFKLVP